MGRILVHRMGDLEICMNTDVLRVSHGAARVVWGKRLQGTTTVWKSMDFVEGVLVSEINYENKDEYLKTERI